MSAPLRDRFKFGVIYPVDLDTNLEKLKFDINVENDVQLANIERLRQERMVNYCLHLLLNLLSKMIVFLFLLVL